MHSEMVMVWQHGGHSNAFTAAEHTNFHFDVSADYLDEALARFAQFFICPLLSADATSREINAVDSENSKNLTMDIWRMNQVSFFFQYFHTALSFAPIFLGL
jgi:insulysin